MAVSNVATTESYLNAIEQKKIVGKMDYLGHLMMYTFMIFK
jgi:hypothetical protein